VFNVACCVSEPPGQPVEAIPSAGFRLAPRRIVGYDTSEIPLLLGCRTMSAKPNLLLGIHPDNCELKYAEAANHCTQ
jgi:hypothetical protein